MFPSLLTKLLHSTKTVIAAAASIRQKVLDFVYSTRNCCLNSPKITRFLHSTRNCCLNRQKLLDFFILPEIAASIVRNCWISSFYQKLLPQPSEIAGFLHSTRNCCLNRQKLLDFFILPELAASTVRICWISSFYQKLIPQSIKTITVTVLPYYFIFL